eukprot:COSAG02_NODE_446_length_22141_cov_17.963842_4_plen_77_part_00
MCGRKEVRGGLRGVRAAGRPRASRQRAGAQEGRRGVLHGDDDVDGGREVVFWEAEPILVLTRREGAGFVLTRDHSN